MWHAIVLIMNAKKSIVLALEVKKVVARIVIAEIVKI
jgi:hypothetical protein